MASAGFDVYTLARTAHPELSQMFGVGTDSAFAYVERARLATLRGIGTHHATLMHAAGINSVDDLSRAQAHELIDEVERLTGERLKPARVRVWIKGAQEEAPRNDVRRRSRPGGSCVRRRRARRARRRPASCGP
jgi:nucleotidyltransferase/DNA polymerase involved in DNA repair